ncbi:hypothetical protein [Aquisphaera insulae]|uniref:hypothetical protein n=1 Tax=Aquisphaera insulae TaxID=2712864 RepID=UPI0013ED50F6|nr:hypothetical protein [Aquisphaera insulae]
MGKSSRKRRREQRGGLGRVMVIVALAAVGLATTRGLGPMYLGAFGPLVGILLWFLYTGMIEGRRLEGFHYATAVVTVPASGFLARQIALGDFRPLGPVAFRSQATTLVAHLIGAALSLMLGLAAGLAVRRLEQARGWDLATFFRGALVGSFLAIPILLVVFNQESLVNLDTRDRLTALAVLGAGFAIGGIVEALRA